MRSIIFILLFPVQVFAQQADYHFMLSFNDKNSSYNISKPEEFLSSKSIERRTKYKIQTTVDDLPVSADYIKQLTEKGFIVRGKSRWLNAVLVSMHDSIRINEIKSFSFIKSIDYLGKSKQKIKGRHGVTPHELNFQISESGGEEIVTDSRPAKEVYSSGYDQIQMLNGIALHNLGFRGQNINIAVLDAGFYNADQMDAFKYVFTQEHVLGVKDFVTGADSVFEDDSHGMNVWSCMAANEPGKFVGTAPWANYWLCRTEDGASEFPVEEFYWLMGAEFADSAGADLISSSLGYTTFDDASLNHKYSDLQGTSIAARAAHMASQKGILVCNSAGNEGDEKWKFIGTPADAHGILTIGAVNSSGRPSAFSSWGPTADGRLKPSFVAIGEGTVVASVLGSYQRSNGTSFSTPVFSGMLACLLQAHPDKAHSEIIGALIKSSTLEEKADHKMGFGIPNFFLAHKILSKDYPAEIDQILYHPDSTGLKPGDFIAFYSANEQNAVMKIQNAKGKIVKNEKRKLTGKSISKFPFPSDLKSGRYRIWIETVSGKYEFLYKQE